MRGLSRFKKPKALWALGFSSPEVVERQRLPVFLEVALEPVAYPTIDE